MQEIKSRLVECQEAMNVLSCEIGFLNGLITTNVNNPHCSVLVEARDQKVKSFQDKVTLLCQLHELLQKSESEVEVLWSFSILEYSKNEMILAIKILRTALATNDTSKPQMIGLGMAKLMVVDGGLHYISAKPQVAEFFAKKLEKEIPSVKFKLERSLVREPTDRPFGVIL